MVAGPQKAVFLCVTKYMASGRKSCRASARSSSTPPSGLVRATSLSASGSVFASAATDVERTRRVISFAAAARIGNSELR
jgi:hypothetical protein